MPFSYNKDRMIEEFAKYMIADELPFNHGESKNLEYFNRVALQPLYRAVPRNTLKRHTQSQYYEERGKLMEMFRNLDCRVCLTTDTWSSLQDEPFMCVTAHWIDDNWILQKRIIAFEVMYESHNGVNIKTRLIDVCKRFHLVDKIFTLSVDNATANTKAIDFLILDQNFPKILNGELFHIRCCAHVLNLSAQDGLTELQPLIGPIRQVIKWIRCKGECKREYIRKCRELGLKKRLHPLDCKTRWNSTYKMLSGALLYRDVLSSIYNTRVDESQAVTDTQWDLAKQVCDVLKAYYDATLVFSFVYEPNVHLVLLHACQVVITINQYMDVPVLIPILNNMKSKWLNYFMNIPPIYTIATILDPGVNFRGTLNLLEFYYSTLQVTFDVNSYLDHCKKILFELFSYYASIYDPESVQSRQIPTSRFNPIMASIINKSFASGSGSSSSSSTSEIDDYINTRWETSTNNFHILKWWKAKSSKYPVLSRIAKDILAIPASTIASESAFSAGRRVLDEKRSRLSPANIEMCVCKKDWDQAQKRTQGILEEDDEDSDDPFMQLSTETETSTDVEGEAN